MFSLFAQFWVLAFFLHHAEDWKYPATSIVAMLLAVWTTFARDRAVPFTVSLAVFTVVNVEKLPHLANHANYYTLICVCLLLWIAGVWWRNGRRLDEETLARAFPGVRPTLCLSLFVVYWMAGFHKLNAGFFDPDVSCAADFFLRYAREYDFPESVFPRWLLDTSPYLVVFVELAGALLLLVPRLQVLGILAFVLLHSYLVPLSFYDFASICYGILLCFLPPRLFEGSANRARAERGMRVLVVAMLVGNVVSRFLEDEGLEDWIAADNAMGWFFLAGSLTLIVQVVRNARASGLRLLDLEGVNLFAFREVRPRWMWLMPLLLLVYTNTSYLGLRTAGNTTMFSNLRTEDGVSNHFLVSSSWQPFGFQRDVLYVEAIPEEFRDEMRGQPEVGMGMTRFELRRIAERWRGRGEEVPMRFRQGNRIYSYDDITEEDEWARPLPWIAKKLMLFREIQPDGPNECRW